MIQVQRDDFENEDQLMDAYRQRSNSLLQHSQRLPLPPLDEQNLSTVFIPEAIVNPAYAHEEEYFSNGMYIHMKRGQGL